MLSSSARDWYRRLYWLRHDAPNLWRFGLKPTILYAGIGGIGDELLCTTSLHEWHRRGATNLIVVARHAELFRGHTANPQVLAREHSLLRTAATWNLSVYHPCEWQRNDPQDVDRQLPPRDHTIAENCRAAGLSGSISIRPYLSLTDAERAAGRLHPRQIVIQTSGAGAQYHYANKEWIADRFHGVAEALRARFHVVQVGSACDPLLSGVTDLRGRTSLRETAAILAGSRFFVGLEGFLMHLARAVDTRSVIIFGGHTRPDQIGYVCNENIYRAPPCAPCWRKMKCDAHHVCMTDISVADAVAATERADAQFGLPLETAELVL